MQQIRTQPAGPKAFIPTENIRYCFDPLKVPFAKLKGARSGPLTGKIRMGLMTHGVDIMGAPGGFVSATHGGGEIEKTVHALRQTVRALKAEREVKAA